MTNEKSIFGEKKSPIACKSNKISTKWTVREDSEDVEVVLDAVVAGELNLIILM